MDLSAAVTTGIYSDITDKSVAMAAYYGSNTVDFDFGYAGEKAGFSAEIECDFDASSEDKTALRLNPFNAWVKGFDGKLTVTGGYLYATNSWASPIYSTGLAYYDYGVQVAVSPVSGLTLGALYSIDNTELSYADQEAADVAKTLLSGLNVGARYKVGFATIIGGYGWFYGTTDNAWLGATIVPASVVRVQADLGCSNVFGINSDVRTVKAAERVFVYPIDGLAIQERVRYQINTSTKKQSINEYLKVSYDVTDYVTPFVNAACVTKDLSDFAGTTVWMVQPGADWTICDNLSVSTYYTYSTSPLSYGYYALNKGSSVNVSASWSF